MRQANSEYREVNEVPATEKIKIPNYCMKMQIYPSAAQKETLDKFFYALHVAYNITFHEVFQKNPMVCTEPNAKGEVWPDFKKMTSKSWRAYLIKCNPAIEDAPAGSLMPNEGLFKRDGQRAWKDGMHNRPVSENLRKEFRFYNKGRPRRSFTVQIDNKNLIPSRENGKVAWIKIPKVEGKIKARGFNRKLWFGENGELDYYQAAVQGKLADCLVARVSKDNCGSYYVSVTFSEGKAQNRQLYLESPAAQDPAPIGMDVGIKDIAILNNGQKVENKRFKQKRKDRLSRMNRKLSGRWGPANPGFRDYNREIRKENISLPQTERIPIAQPSKRYLKLQRNRAKLERRIARQRESYYHQQTSVLVRQSSLIAVETLQVKNMLRNHKLAFALSDAAMSDFISKLKYKAARRNVEIRPIGTFEPSSQLCSVCGEQYPRAKNLGVRRWTCPKCGTAHDRDVNAARNILAIALAKGSAADDPPAPANAAKPPTVRRRKMHAVLADAPELAITFSKELSGINNPRYIIINSKTKQIIDDAQGVGYRSISNAKNCYKAKKNRAVKA